MTDHKHDFPERPISIELTNLAQGANKAVFTWPYAPGGTYTTISISSQSLPTIQHSFTFFKGATNLGAVTQTTAGTGGTSYWATTGLTVTFAAGDIFTVRHDTTAEDADEGVHIDESGRIWAHLT